MYIKTIFNFRTMTTKINITIPKPCHENWNAMTPVEKGRFCSMCEKKVFDFRNASDRQIIEAYNQDKNLCGRFLKSQLDRDLETPKEKKSIWLASVFFGLLSLSNAKVNAQEKPKTEQVPMQPVIMGKKMAPQEISNEHFFEINGIVVDGTGPIPGANIIIKGNTKGVSTDFDGKFKIKVKIGDVLIISGMGMKEKQIKIKDNIRKTLTIKVKLEERVLGGLGVIEKSSKTSIANICKSKLVQLKKIFDV